MPLIKTGSTMDPTINTLDGQLYSYKTHDFSKLTVDGLAGALAKICRFTGHCTDFYSVAEHSVIVSRLVPKNAAFLGLIHDLHEAVMGDMNSPLKSTQPTYKAAETFSERMLRERLKVWSVAYRTPDGSPFSVTPEDEKAVKKADTLVYLAERTAIMPPLPADHPEHYYIPLPKAGTLEDRTVKEAMGMIRCLDWRDARDSFLERYRELTNAVA